MILTTKQIIERYNEINVKTPKTKLESDYQDLFNNLSWATADEIHFIESTR